MKTAFFFSLLLAFGIQSYAQERFRISNPSFESNQPAQGTTPKGWIDLGFKNMTPVDIQPGTWSVETRAQDGKVYVGMAVRDNMTWEGIGQALDGYLQKDSTYEFSVWLATSRYYYSRTVRDSTIVNYNAPTILKIWGYNSKTDTQELLAESEPIVSERWTQYEFTLKPTGNYNEIDLVAYYAPGYLQENGNLLIDNCSDIVKVRK